jgi:hypothetical protein
VVHQVVQAHEKVKVEIEIKKENTKIVDWMLKTFSKSGIQVIKVMQLIYREILVQLQILE